jgi:hypothetical protein
MLRGMAHAQDEFDGRGVVILAALLAAAACGGGNKGSATVTGSVAGVSLGNVAEAMSVDLGPRPCPNGSGAPGPWLNVTIDDRGGSCTALQRLEVLAAASLLNMQVSNNSFNPIQPGSYAIGQTFSNNNFVDVQARFSHTDANCGSTASAQATAGTITLTTIEPGAVAGTFDLTFPGGTLSGSFHTANCTLPQSVLCATDTLPGCAH